MEKTKGVLNLILKYYMVYMFIFGVLLFAIQKPQKTENNISLPPEYHHLAQRQVDRVALVESAEDAILVRLNLIANAKESLDISYYTLIQGDTTQVMLASILDAADRGVEVRILLDGIFNNLRGNLKDAIYGFELHPNISLKLYEQFNILSPWTWNNRLHDKLIMADEQLALIGGRNIGDKYFLQEQMKENFVKDRDVLIYREDTGGASPSVITDMKNYYDHIWDYKHAKAPIKALTAKQIVKARAFNDNLRNIYKTYRKQYESESKALDWHQKTLPTESIKFVYNPIGRVNQDPWCLRELLELSAQVKTSMLIQSPYIIPSRSMKDKVAKYDIDLEKITMLTNSVYSSPNPIGISGYINHKKSIIDKGIKVYEYQGPESIHGKTYIFDDTISVIGSFNFDARSSYINSESMVVITSKEFTAQLIDNVKVDLQNSLKVGKNYAYIGNNTAKEGQVTLIKKVTIWLLSKITFFLEHLL